MFAHQTHIFKQERGRKLYSVLDYRRYKPDGRHFLQILYTSSHPFLAKTSHFSFIIYLLENTLRLIKLSVHLDDKEVPTTVVRHVTKI